METYGIKENKKRSVIHILVIVQSYVTSMLVNLSSPRGPNTNSDQLLCYCYCLLRLMWELHRADKKYSAFFELLSVSYSCECNQY